METIGYYRVKISKDFDSLSQSLFSTINFRTAHQADVWLRNKGYIPNGIATYRKGILTAKITEKVLAFGIEEPPTRRGYKAKKTVK